jgi:hypothetical protein
MSRYFSMTGCLLLGSRRSRLMIPGMLICRNAMSPLGGSPIWHLPRREAVGGRRYYLQPLKLLGSLSQNLTTITGISSLFVGISWRHLLSHPLNGTDPSTLTDLSIRFFGVGTKRLLQTIVISNGLTSPSSRSVVPTHVFPPGRWKESKTPRVSKGKLTNLHTASVGEVVFTDTFDSGDSKYKYGQVYYDYVSGWGDIFPLRSRTEVGNSLADFCCRNWIPLCLVSDNAGENVGGEIDDVTRRLCIQRVYICPRHPMQNYAEGFLGRLTAMASFAMVYAGPLLFMWIYAIRAAVFFNNITAKYYRKQDLWAQPYQIVHGEAFADSSIVVPFECRALILRDSNDRSKFQSKCTLMIFLHYADEHPMFTYAFYSPRTKRVLYRPNAIFLPTLFPMRLARQASNLDANGDVLLTFRSPISLRIESPPELSFGDWSSSDSLPDFEDDVAGFDLGEPRGRLVHEPQEIPELPVHVPDHPAFPTSAVTVPIPASAALVPTLSRAESLKPPHCLRSRWDGRMIWTHVIIFPARDDQSVVRRPRPAVMLPCLDPPIARSAIDGTTRLFVRTTRLI